MKAALKQSRVALGEIATELQRRLADRAEGGLCLKHPQPAGEIDEVAHLVQFRPIYRCHVDGTLHDTARQKIDEQIRRFDRNRFLRFRRTGAQVRREHDIGRFEKEAVRGRWLLLEDVESSARDVAADESSGERLFVDDTASSDIQKASRPWASVPIRGRQ